MKSTHETLNSIGVVVAIVLSFSGIISVQPGVPIIGGGNYNLDLEEEKSRLEKVGGELFVYTRYQGYITIHNTSDSLIYVQVDLYPAKDCRDGADDILVTTKQNAWASSSWELTEIPANEIKKVNFLAGLYYRPDISGDVCSTVRITTSRGDRYFFPYRIDAFSNVFWNSSPEVIQAAYGTKADTYRNTDVDIPPLTEDEVNRVLLTGEEQAHSATVEQVRTQYRRTGIYPVPARVCLRIFGFQQCLHRKTIDEDQYTKMPFAHKMFLEASEAQ